VCCYTAGVIIARLLFLLPLASVLFADQVVLKNGDTLTGSIVKKDDGKLTIKSEFLGEVSMPWSAVQSIRSDESLTVELPGEERVVGKVTTTGETLQVTTATATRTAPLAQVGAVRNPAEQRTWERLQHPGILELWTGFFDMGLALARGNARTDTLTSTFNATRVTRKDKLSVTFNQIYGSARVDNVTSTIASAVRGGWSYNRDVTPRLFVSTLNDYEHDRFQNLDLRFVAGLGLGANVIKEPNTSLSFTGGGDYMRETFMLGVARNSAEANVGDDFLHKFSPTTNVTQTFRFFPNLSHSGEYRVNFDLGAVTALKKWLGWHVTASDRFLSNPVFGRQRNDLLISTGLRVSFAK
jgi:putative salt-induced outer membrane protein YdiY